MEIVSEEQLNKEKRVLWLSYALFVLFFTAPIGVVISLIRSRRLKAQAGSQAAEEDTITAVCSHHTWLVRTFLVTILVSMMGLGTLYYGVGYVLFTIAAVWWIYRLARGVVGLIETRPMPVWT